MRHGHARVQGLSGLVVTPFATNGVTVYSLGVALNIKNRAVEELTAELSALTGQSKTETIRQALERRRAELVRSGRAVNRRVAVMHFLENEVWPLIPEDQIGRRPTSAEEDEILGFGPEGV